MKMKFRGLAIAMVIGTVAGARADYTITLNELINGTAPDGSAPYITLDFSNDGANSVLLTITNHMPTQDFTPDLLFNVTGVSSMSFTHESGIVAASTSFGSTSGGASMHAGTFDAEMTYATSNGSGRLAGGDSSVYLLTGTGLVDTDFDAMSTGTQGGWLSAAKTQGYTNGGSGTVGGPPSGTPEPFTLALGAFGVGLGFIRSRRKS
jgi:hypothetical protein